MGSQEDSSDSVKSSSRGIISDNLFNLVLCRLINRSTCSGAQSGKSCPGMATYQKDIEDRPKYDDQMSATHTLVEETIWKVGCYQINPTTPRGQKFFILHMLVDYTITFLPLSSLQVLPLIPITALVIQNSVTMNTLLGYQNKVSTLRRQVRDSVEGFQLTGLLSLE